MYMYTHYHIYKNQVDRHTVAWIAIVHLRSTAMYNDFQADSTDLCLIEPSIPKVLGIYNHTVR